MPISGHACVLDAEPDSDNWNYRSWVDLPPAAPENRFRIAVAWSREEW